MSDPNTSSRPDNIIKLDNERHDLLWGVQRSVRYHMARKRFFLNWHHVTSALVVIFTSSTATVLLTTAFGISGSGAAVAAGLAAVAAIAAALDMVFAITQKAWTHGDLAKQWINLERDIVKSNPRDENALKAFQDQRLVIEMEEPPILEVLDIQMHNALCKARGFAKSQQYKIGFFQSLLSQFVDIRPNSIERNPIAKGYTERPADGNQCD